MQPFGKTSLSLFAVIGERQEFASIHCILLLRISMLSSLPPLQVFLLTMISHQSAYNYVTHWLEYSTTLSLDTGSTVLVA